MVAHACCLLCTDDAPLDCLLLDPVQINAAAVINDFNVDLAPFVEGAHFETAFCGFALLHSHVGRFNAVVDGVADDVSKRIFDRLDNRLVEFCVFALHLEPNFLPAARREVAHHSGKFAPDVANRLHSRFHRAALKFRCNEV